MKCDNRDNWDELYPSNLPRMLNKDFTRLMQSLSRVRQNRGKERKTADRVGLKVFAGNC